MKQVGITFKILFLYFLYYFMDNSKAKFEVHLDAGQLYGDYHFLTFCLTTLL